MDLYIKLSKKSLNEVCNKFGLRDPDKSELLRKVLSKCHPDEHQSSNPLHIALLTKYYESYSKTMNTFIYYKSGEIVKYKFILQKATTVNFYYVYPQRGEILIKQSFVPISDYSKLMHPDDTIKFKVLYKNIFDHQKKLCSLYLTLSDCCIIPDLQCIVLQYLFLF
jgi:hypothetical protein